jgi:FkbM family methyltransferase
MLIHQIKYVIKKNMKEICRRLNPRGKFHLWISNAQAAQDIFVWHYIFGGKKNGFYLEIGAGDGIHISNTLLLERKGWTGILVEPSSVFKRLNENRSSSICVNACVGGERGSLDFVEIADTGQTEIYGAPESNTLLSRVKLDNDWLDKNEAKWGKAISTSVKQSVRLEDILDENHAPATIDYFSLDIEGMEFTVMRNFPFDRYVFSSIGIEKPSSDLIKLLEANGYRYESTVGYDDFFLHESFQRH